MLRPTHTHIFLFGLLSAGLFLVVFGLGLGFLFMFLPTLPLFLIGLRGDTNAALASMVIASVGVTIIAGISAAALYLILLGFPAWYICMETLRTRKRHSAHSHEWLPIGTAFTHLTLFACGFLALVVAYYTKEPGGITAVLATSISATLTSLPAEFTDAVHKLSTSWSFLIFCVTLWMWALALYGHGWFAHRMLRKRNLSPRHDFSIHPFPMPQWMLGLLAIAALASLIDSDSMRFLGKSTLISLALPYFLAGIGLMHQSSHKWPNRRVLLFFIYFMVFSQFWPALIVAASGLWHQIKHLSGGETSSSS